MTRPTRSSRRRNGARGSIRSLDSFSNESFSDDDHSDGCGSTTVLGLVGLAIVGGLIALFLVWQPWAPEQEQWCQEKPPVKKSQQQDLQESPGASSSDDSEEEEKGASKRQSENESEDDKAEQLKEKKERQKLKKAKQVLDAKQKEASQKLNIEKKIRKLETQIEDEEKARTKLDKQEKNMGKDSDKLQEELKLLKTCGGSCAYVANIPPRGCYVGFGVVIFLAIIGIIYWAYQPRSEDAGDLVDDYCCHCSIFFVVVGFVLWPLVCYGGCFVSVSARKFKLEEKLENRRAKKIWLDAEKIKMGKAAAAKIKMKDELEKLLRDSNSEEQSSADE